VAVSFLGVFLIATQGRIQTLSFNIGDLMALGSMAMWAGYTVFLRLRRDALETPEFLVVVCSFGLLFMSPWILWEFMNNVKTNLTPTGALAVLYSAVGSLLLAYASWSYVVTRLGAARAGVTMHLMPGIGVVLSIIFLGEYPRWFHGAGIALILAGVALSSWRGNRSKLSP
jgi:drug/metabolite transporter (DMT)-like permease